MNNKPTQNEAEELKDLVDRIDELIVLYGHVAKYIPKGLSNALDKMYSHHCEYTGEVIKRDVD